MKWKTPQQADLVAADSISNATLNVRHSHPHVDGSNPDRMLLNASGGFTSVRSLLPLRYWIGYVHSKLRRVERWYRHQWLDSNFKHRCDRGEPRRPDGHRVGRPF